MNPRKPPLGLPGLVYIVVFHVGKEEVPLSDGAAEILHQISSEYASACSEVDGGLRLALDPLEGYVEGFQEEDFQAILVALGPMGSKKPPRISLQEQKTYDDELEQLKSLLPENPLLTTTLRVGWTKSKGEAQRLLQGFLSKAERSVKSMGTIHNCLLAMLKEVGSVDSSHVLRREFILLPFRQDSEEAASAVWDLCGDLTLLAACAGGLNQLRSRHALALSQIDASEKSTQVRINEIFADMRRPMEERQPRDLEGVLREVTTLYSDLSILASTMKRDYVKAQRMLRQARSLFRAWNEEPLAPYPTNSSMEEDAYRNLMAPFEDFIERVNALRIQLNTVLDAARTYLGVQEQRLSIEEQTSSKNLLARLVGLQEVLHKLEILIVAFYITEMGRFVFEAVAHDMVDILTVVFIPVALVLAVGIIRLLHRGGKE